MKLFEIYTEKNNVQYETSLTNLYHLTNYKGLTITVLTGILRSKTQPYISATSNINESVIGGDHYDFKFILDAQRLANDYGVFDVKDYRTVGDDIEIMEENEVGIDTNSIDVFKYSKGLIIMIDILSKKFLQWMFYKISGINSVGANSIEKLFNENFPIYKQNGENLKYINKNEKEFLKHCIELGNMNYSFREALSELVKYYNIKDHDGKIINIKQPKREELAKEKAINVLNDTLTNKKIKDIDSNEVTKMFSQILDILEYNNDFKDKFINKIKDMGLNTPLIPPVKWTPILRSLIKDDNWNEIEKELEYIKRFELGPMLKRLENDDLESYFEGKHTKTKIS